MSRSERPSGRRVMRPRPSLLEELTDDVEPDESWVSEALLREALALA